MKSPVNLFVILLITAFIGSLSSCSKCYECQAPIEVKTPDTSYTTYQNQEICTANSREIEAKENEGYICN